MAGETVMIDIYRSKTLDLNKEILLPMQLLMNNHR